LIELTSKQLRRLALDGQGLMVAKPFGTGVGAVLKALEHLHYVQIDTISVVDRAHHHVFKTRVADYSPEMLHQLQATQRSVFEYWSHAAAYLPMRDYRFYLPIMLGYRNARLQDLRGSSDIISRIRAEGPLRSKDFVTGQGKSNKGWWNWKPAKIALERLFLSGDLMISERKGFQKVYDLTERVLPASVNTQFPTDDERGKFYIRGMLSNLGVAQLRDITYSKPSVKRLSGFNILPCVTENLNEMLDNGEVVPVRCRQEIFYCLHRTLQETIKVGPKRIRILSPFDNLVINRRRLLDLFGFNYQLECYVPRAKRQYGYFVLPLLYGDKFIGRLDCKAERKTGNLLINNIWLESSTTISAALIKQLVLSLQRFKADLGCANVLILHVDNSQLRKTLSQIMAHP